MSGPTPSKAPEQILGHITGARWFAGKGRRAELIGVTPLPWLTSSTEFSGTPGAPAVRLEIAEIGYAGEPDREYYQLAVAYRRDPVDRLVEAEIGRFDDPDLGPVIAYDAARDPQACRVLLSALLAGRQVRGPEETVSFHLADGEGLTTDLEPTIFSGQQSNTSVMFGDVAMIKLFRRLELGRNLDIQVHDALNAAGVDSVAGLFGWIEATWVGGGAMLAADLAMAVEKLSQATDGWELALDQLREGRSFAGEAEALGRALAEIHLALQSAFPAVRVLGASVSATMTQRLDRAAEIAPALIPYVAGLRRSFDALDELTLDTQRVHGDFHLGQTLHTPSGWKIIDFEGEPVKTMAERLVPDSIWRDIAGMLRSFDYAAASVPEVDGAQWKADCRAAFLRGYAGGEPTAEQTALLRAYEADKAIYEVVYETRNRPDWLPIPLGAVARISGHDQDPARMVKE